MKSNRRRLTYESSQPTRESTYGRRLCPFGLLLEHRDLAAFAKLTPILFNVLMKFTPFTPALSGDVLFDIAIADHDACGDRSVSIAFSGWVLVRLGTAASIEFWMGGAAVASAKVQFKRPDVMMQVPCEYHQSSTCGYQVRLSKFVIPEQYVLEVVVIVDLPNGGISRIHLGMVELSAPIRLQLRYVERYQPLLVTGLGRSGSTLLMGLLASHPAVVVPGAPPFELRQLTYLWHALSVLTAPADYGGSMDLDSFEIDHSRLIGFNPFAHLNFARVCNASLSSWQDEEWPSRATDFIKEMCDRYVDGFPLSANTQLRYIAEKSLVSGVRHVVQNIYSDAREIFMVRDLRDTWISALRFNEKRGTQSFERQKFATDEEWFRAVIASYRVLRVAYEAARPRAHLIRYEDLIMSPERVLKELFVYLGVDGSPERIQQCRERMQGVGSTLQGHATSTTVLESCGRWRREMSDEKKSIARGMLEPDLKAFGYSLD